MSAIWANGDQGWQLVSPVGFSAEAALHDLVEHAPNVLPLAGIRQLTILGREVLLGGNYADLIAVEPSGRLAVIEIKLSSNAEARRAVVAQILTYAAFLRGMEPTYLEGVILQPHLQKLNHQTIAGVLQGDDQLGDFDAGTFDAGLRESLSAGAFRLVLVLDKAPDELVRLTGYLDAVADKLQIDLITVSAYQIGETQVVVPQRVDPERKAETKEMKVPLPGNAARYVEGSEEFETSIIQAPEAERARLHELLDWARKLEQHGLAQLVTTVGTANRWVLNPLVPGQGRTGMMSIWNEKGAYITFHSTVITRCAPGSLAAIEQAAAPTRVGQGTTTRTFTPELLKALERAYEEASGQSSRLEPTSVD